MNIFMQAWGLVLIGLILVQTLGSGGKQMGTLLVILICVSLGTVLLGYLKPVLDFLQILHSLSGVSSEMIATLLKITGIGLISEISALICADAGCAAMGKSLQLAGSGVILWLSLPLFTALADLLQQILGEL